MEDYYKSLSLEISGLSNRVRFLIGQSHFPSDGKWKEAIISSILRRNIPDSYDLCSGFVVSNRGKSSEIDILVYDKERPKLFRNGDFIITTPDAVQGIIEVKSTFYPKKFKSELKKISKNIKYIRDDGKRRPREGKIFAGLVYFSIKSPIGESLLSTLSEICNEVNSEIDYIVIGHDYIVKYWEFGPTGENGYKKWHLYKLSSLGFGYFVGNVIQDICRYSVIGNNSFWFPNESKENRLLGKVDFIV